MGQEQSTSAPAADKDQPKFKLTINEYNVMKRELIELAEIFIGEKNRKSPAELELLIKSFLVPSESVMGTDERTELSKKAYPVGPDGKRLKPCCACPETKRARDACVVEKGEENCTELIEAHKACMRSMGFNI